MMNNLRFLLIILLIFNFKSGLSQNSWDKLTLIKTIDVQSQLIATDKLGNLYAVTNQEFFKYDADGKFLQKNSLKSLGDLFALDVSNPMKILAFYKDYNKILFLDNMLAPSGGTIDLSSIGFDQATLACTSHDNGIWLFNSLNFEIVRFDHAIKITNQSGNIAQLTGNAVKPTTLFETNNRVYLCDTLIGVLVFDVFGTYIKTIPIPAITDLQVENNTLYFINDKGFGSFDMVLLQQNEIQLPENGTTQIRLQKNRVYFKLADKIAIYGY